MSVLLESSFQTTLNEPNYINLIEYTAKNWREKFVGTEFFKARRKSLSEDIKGCHSFMGLLGHELSSSS